MSIERIQIKSKEMKGVIRFVKAMTQSMTFDENMENANWPKQRKRNNFFYRLMPRRKDVKRSKKNIGNLGALYAEPADGASREDIIIVYMHGGGFVTGSAFVCKSYVSMLSKYSGCRVYAIEYSLAPEKPFPHGFNDCCKAFEDIMACHPNAKFILTGESAGGNYSLALTHKYKDTGKIIRVIVHSPTVDFSGSIDHTQNENKDFIVKLGCNAPLTRMYAGTHDLKDPSLSPIYGDFNGFPQTLITCDTNETLYADSKALYEKCIEAGVDVTMVEFTGGYHACAVSGSNTPETLYVLLKGFLNL